MSSPRVAEEGITRDVREIYRETQDIKLRQRVDTEVTIIKRTFTGSSWDATGIVPGIETRRVRVKFTPTNGGRPYAEMDFDYLSASIYLRYSQEADPASAGYTNMLSWIVRIDNFSGITDYNFYVKAYIYCVDSGSLSFEVF